MDLSSVIDLTDLLSLKDASVLQHFFHSVKKGIKLLPELPHHLMANLENVHVLGMMQVKKIVIIV